MRRLDEVQQRRPWLAFPLAVVKKFGDDRAGSHAALISYYGFFSLFPLLLALVTILGLVLRDQPQLQQRIVDSAVAQIPVVGPQIRNNVGHLSGSWLVLAVSLIGAIWSGLGVVRAAQVAMDDIWDVPEAARLGLVPRLLRSLLFLVVFAVAVAITGALAGVASSSMDAVGVLLRIGAIVATVLVNVVLFAAAFRVLTAADVPFRDVLPGAAVAAAAWAALQLLGGYLVQRQLQGAREVYGFFAVVIGLLFWISLAAQVTLLAAEVNVVRARSLWPRSLLAPRS